MLVLIKISQEGSKCYRVRAKVKVALRVSKALTGGALFLFCVLFYKVNKGSDDLGEAFNKTLVKVRET